MKSKIISIIVMFALVLVVVLVLTPCESPAMEKVSVSINQKLILAVEKGELDKFKTLLKKGADVNAKTPFGIRPLMAAARGDNLNIVKFLVDKGADVNAKDIRGMTVLM